ncbi:MAG: glycosyltransferase [Pseudomonadota bacterium]|nr:glycosyltransferase [Pseudomonadota bacterium]
MEAVKYSLIVPVYRNEASIPELVEVIWRLNDSLGGALEAVLVVDGSPDRSAEILDAALLHANVRAQLLVLSRNFGSFAAIRAGLAAASGRYCATMAADLQEPESLALDLFRALEHEPVDVALGVRTSRSDPWRSRLASSAFWSLYRTFVQRDIPAGGVDVFACNGAVRDHLLQLEESNSSLIGQVMWLGFRRKLVPYVRLPRRHGRSAWTLSRKLRYLVDSVYSFSDLPIRVLTWAGFIGLITSSVLAIAVIIAKVQGDIPIPGYAATVLTIIFFAALNSFGLGIIGGYTWRAFENTKRRPQAIVLAHKTFNAEA